MKSILDMSCVSQLIMLDIDIWNKSIGNYSQMLITLDTGATVTTISTDLLHLLGYDTADGKEIRIITASSVEYVKSVRLEKIRLGEFELYDVEVYAHTFPESSFSLGVLGLNVLRNFDVNLSFSKKEIELTSI